MLACLRRHSDEPASIPEAEPTARSVELDPAVLALVGDEEHGEYLATECLTRHRADGSSEGIPFITRWPVEEVVVAMHACKKKLRPPPVMQMLAGRPSNEEIAVLAACFGAFDE